MKFYIASYSRNCLFMYFYLFTHGYIFTPPGNVTLTPSTLNYEAVPQYLLIVQATDSGGLSASINITLNITDVNDPPVLAPFSTNISVPEDLEGASSLYLVPAADEDGDVLIYSIITWPDSHTFVITQTGKLKNYS